MDTDWLHAARRATDRVRAILESAPSSAERERETGTIGYGGDATLEIDEAAEDAFFDELQRLHDEGARFSAISEERGEVSFGARFPMVVIDPIDGSVNAKRGLRHHAVSLAVASGPTMNDVFFGFVHDFGPEEEWTATRGGGATLDGRPVGADAQEKRGEDGKLELLGLESADPRWIRDAADDLADAAGRVRVLGSIAVSLCQVADGRFDAMLTLRRCRPVDAAAAQLIVRESGGAVCFAGCPEPLGAPLDGEFHFPLIAARTERALSELAGVPIR